MSESALRRGSDVLAVLAVVAFVLAVVLGQPVLAAVGLALLLAAVQTTRVVRRRRKARRPQRPPGRGSGQPQT